MGSHDRMKPTANARVLTNGANGAIISPRCTKRQRAPSAEGVPVDAQLTHLRVADAVLIRTCLLYYESRLMTAPRHGESDEVCQAVVQTMDSLRRLDRALHAWITHVDRAIDRTMTDEGADDDIPF